MCGRGTRFDVIVVGVGSMGSAACYHLARRGVGVLGLEQFDVPHALGSAHGHSRMIRLAYFEHPGYVALLRRSYALWHDLSRELGQDLIHITGGLMLGPPGAPVVDGSLRAAREHALPHDLLDAAETRRRFPQFVIPDDYRALHDHSAGFVLPERAVAGHAELALRHGAEIHGREPVLDWHATANGVTVRTPRATYSAGHVVFAGGAWTDRLVRDLGVPLTVTRQPQVWVWPRDPAHFALGRFPVWILEHRDGTNHYGFPLLPGTPGLKIATHTRADPVPDVDALDRTPRDTDETDVRRALHDHLPAADGPLLATRICMYTNTPDHHFILDRHPAHPNVTLAAGFSGHGFKFAPLIGEALADLATVGWSRHPIDFLSLARFAPSR